MIDYQEYLLKTGLNMLRPYGNKFNAQCCRCDDALVRKHRLWFMRQNDNNYIVKCHNGGCVYETATSLLIFLLNEFPNIGEELKDAERKQYFEHLKDNRNLPQKDRKRKSYINNTKLFNKDKKIKFVDSLNENIFKSIYEKQEAIEYLQNRKIDEKFYKDWFYVDENLIEHNFAGNIVIPLVRNSDNKIYGFNSRNIFEKKFINTLFSEDAYKIYNLYNVDVENSVYIFESIFDSLYVENSIACCGAGFPEELLISYFKRPIFCFDYDETGLNKSIEYLIMGYEVFIFPEKHQISLGKKIDMNDLVNRNDMKKEDIRKMIVGNTICGKKHIVKLLMLLKKNRWKVSDHLKRILK